MNYNNIIINKMIFSLLILITIPFLIVLVGLLFEKKRKTFTRMAKASK